MNEQVSERYQKNLVTVAMGLRKEQDIKKNGLYRFTKKDKNELLKHVESLFNKNKKVLALKIRNKGYRSEHINIKTKEQFESFIQNIENIYEKQNEIWIVSNEGTNCWRGRIYLSNKIDMIEMAYSDDDHILDHMSINIETPYILYKKENYTFKVSNTNLKEDELEQINNIVNDMLRRYSSKLQKIKEDLTIMNIEGISLDVRINKGYDFHDFDVTYGQVQKVIGYYLPQFSKNKKHKYK